MEITVVKNILGITTDKHDTYLNTVVPLFEEAITDYCNNKFLDESGEVALPGGVKIALAKWCEVNTNDAGLDSETTGGVTYNFSTEIPETIKVHLKKHRRLKFG